jgi:hypothetical protein
MEKLHTYINYFSTLFTEIFYSGFRLLKNSSMTYLKLRCSLIKCATSLRLSYYLIWIIDFLIGSNFITGST